MDKLKEYLDYDLKLKYIIYGYGGYIGLKLLYNIISTLTQKIKNTCQKRKVRKFIQQRDNYINELKIPKPTHLSEDIIQTVLNSDITRLKEMLNNNIVNSQDLVNIYSYRCQQYGIKYGIVTHLKYEQAIELAKQCDLLRQQQSPLTQLPLFGIPISIKETFDEKGYPSTVGCTYRIDYIGKEDGYAVELLKQSGAIPFIRTNVPLGAMIFESVNQVYGRVLNPWDKTKYAGGSSGGEAAAIAARISPGGLGSDIGGSIRIPAAMCGVYGFKPTAQRSAMGGHTFFSEGFSGQRTVLCASGPLGKSVDDLILFFRSLCDPNNMSKQKLVRKDTFSPYQQINEEQLSQKKSGRRFGYFKTTSVFDAAICMQRGVDLAVQALRDQGHQLVEINIPDSEIIHDSFSQFLFADNYQAVFDLIGKEDTLFEYILFKLLHIFSKRGKSVLGLIFRLLGQKALARILPYTNELTTLELNKFHTKIDKLQKSILQLFDDHEIEAIICPSFGAPALAHSSSGDVSSVSFYTFMWNLLNFPCGVLPVTKVLKEEQHYNNSRRKEMTEKMVDHYMKQNTENLPVGIQVVTPPFKEETCLNVMKIIDDKIQFYKHNSFPELN